MASKLTPMTRTQANKTLRINDNSSATSCGQNFKKFTIIRCRLGNSTYAAANANENKQVLHQGRLACFRLFR